MIEPAVILVEFIVNKAMIIEHEFANKNFLLKQDITELLHWPKQECVQVLQNIKKMYAAGTWATCPWCVRYNLKCENCGYGARHKICGEPNSDFRILRKQISDKYGPISIIDIPGMEILPEILETSYNVNYETFCKIHHLEEE